MRTLPNEKLSPNFTLYEFIEGQLPYQGVQMNWANIADFRKDRAIQICDLLQVKRQIINEVFRKQNNDKEIGLQITSGFRSVEWERFRGRNGSSQHTQSWASDVQPVGCSTELAINIIRWLHHIDNEKITGHVGGFAVKWPSAAGIGFLHYDLRGTVARWTY